MIFFNKKETIEEKKDENDKKIKKKKHKKTEENETKLKEPPKKKKALKRKIKNHFSNEEKNIKIELETKKPEKEKQNVHDIQNCEVHVKNDKYSTLCNKKQQIYGKKSKTGRSKTVKKQNQHLIISPELEKQKSKVYVFDKSTLKKTEKENKKSEETINKKTYKIDENIESSWKDIDLTQDTIKEFSLSKKEKKNKKKIDKEIKKANKKIAKQQAKEIKKAEKINKKDAKKNKIIQKNTYKKDNKLSLGARLMVGILILAMFIGMLAPATSFIIV